MALDSLAPDQRAVVQLVLQQGRSYAALAGLLGIADEAVRQRAHAGVIGLGGDVPLDAQQKGRLVDFLLGQQDDAERATTEELLAGSSAARSWAIGVAEELRPVARHGLPEIPAAKQAEAAEPDGEEEEEEEEHEHESEAAAEEPEPGTAASPAVTAGDERAEAETDAPEEEPEPVADAPATAPRAPDRPRAARRRPRRAPPPAATRTGARAAKPAKPRAGIQTPASRVGGAVLIVGLAILLVPTYLYISDVVGDDEQPASPSPTATATSTPTATQQPLAQLPLKAGKGGTGEGLVQINATTGGQIGFTLVARNVTPNEQDNAYAVWLIGKGRPARRLGFTRVAADKTLATSGPEARTDPTQFSRWLTEYSQMVVSRETSDTVREPTKVVLRASLAPLRKG